MIEDQAYWEHAVEQAADQNSPENVRRQRDALRAVLDKIVRIAAPAGVDSCGQSMHKLRTAAIEEARAALASDARTEGGA